MHTSHQFLLTELEELVEELKKYRKSPEVIMSNLNDTQLERYNMWAPILADMSGVKQVKIATTPVDERYIKVSAYYNVLLWVPTTVKTNSASARIKFLSDLLLKVQNVDEAKASKIKKEIKALRI